MGCDMKQWSGGAAQWVESVSNVQDFFPSLQSRTKLNKPYLAGAELS